MAVGDLVVEGGTVGFAAGVALSEPTNLLEVTAATPLSTLVAALEAGDYRILLEAGLNFNLGTAQIDLGSNIQMGCLDGTATLDGTNFLNGAMFMANASTNIFFFNFRFLQSVGIDNSNNPGGFIEIVDNSDLLYFYHIDVEHSLDQAGFGDAPECFNIWNNTTGDATKRITWHGCETTNNVQPSKFSTVGGVASAQPGGADNTTITMYRTVLRSWFRQPLMDGGSQLDMVNSVLPRGLNRGGGGGAEVRASGRMDVRGCSIGESNEFTFGELIHNNSGATSFSYYFLTGKGTDNSIEDGSPIIDADIPSSSTPVVTKPYTLTPTTMTTTLRDTIINEAGPGSKEVTIEAAGGGGEVVEFSAAMKDYRNLSSKFGKFLV